LKSEAAKLVQE